ncbi:Cell wall integrity and stress response component 4 [Hypoxylon texense]
MASEPPFNLDEKPENIPNIPLLPNPPVVDPKLQTDASVTDIRIPEGPTSQGPSSSQPTMPPANLPTGPPADQPTSLTTGPPEEQIQEVFQDMPGYIGATAWAKPYFSNHHHENPQVNTKMLGHVNCGYLSTPGRPPTLESLKQHAQSLTFLISTLAPSSRGGLVDTQNNPDRGKTIDPQMFVENQAFDWLNNLQVPYDNIDRAHKKPLNSLVNLVKKNSDERGVEFHCPMERLPIEYIENNKGRQTFPFQNHMTLLMHANECLERLDHEYSAMGGLLAILPTDRDNVAEHPDLAKAKQTLIGQWLLYTQHLTGRMHELEIAYANALDILAGEALVPAQHLSASGPDGRSGREIVFPQDRWLLANAGEDVFEFIHRHLDRREDFQNSEDEIYRDERVVGDRLQDGSSIRGIVEVDLMTRFYKLKGSGHGTIFVLPAFADRPNTEHIRDMEKRPTVVTIPTPAYPDRTTAWDRRNLGIEQENLQKTIDIGHKDQEIATLRSMNETQSQELERLRVLNRVYEVNQGTEMAEAAQRAAAAETDRDRYQVAFEKGSIERNALKNELAAYKQERRQQENIQVPPGVTAAGDGSTYTLNKDTFGRYVGRSATVDAAKVGIERVTSTIRDLISEGRLNQQDFVWMDDVLNTA